MRKAIILLGLLLLLATGCVQRLESPHPQLPTVVAEAEPAPDAELPEQKRTPAAGGEVAASVPAATTAVPTLLPATVTATPTLKPAATVVTDTSTPSVTFTAHPPPSTPQSSPTLPPLTATPPPPTPTADCPAAWFMADPPDACPAGPPLLSAAASQRFEGGRMLWVEETDTFYILFNAGAYPGDSRTVFETLAGPLVLSPGGSPDNRVGEEPPGGFFEPVSGFGLLWRGEVEGLVVDLRQALHWAVEREFGFEAQLQCERPETYSAQTCYLQDADGSAIVLASHAIAGNVWWRWVRVDG